MKDILQQRFYLDINALKKDLITVLITLITPKYCRTLVESMLRRILPCRLASSRPNINFLTKKCLN